MVHRITPGQMEILPNIKFYWYIDIISLLIWEITYSKYIRIIKNYIFHFIISFNNKMMPKVSNGHWHIYIDNKIIIFHPNKKK